MCDFHSTAWRKIGQDIQMTHLPSNRHSEMIDASGWRVNQPNRTPIVFEAEGTDESDVRIRQCGECHEDVIVAIKRHYRKLAKCIETGDGLRVGEYFADYARWSDVWSRVKSLPENMTWPQTIGGSLDLRGLASLPENMTWPQTIGGSLDLSGLASLPENMTWPQTIGGSLDLRGLASLPENMTWPQTIGGYLYLSGLASLPENMTWPQTIGGYL
jgi:hypothetical protein